MVEALKVKRHLIFMLFKEKALTIDKDLNEISLCLQSITPPAESVESGLADCLLFHHHAQLSAEAKVCRGSGVDTFLSVVIQCSPKESNIQDQILFF